MKITIRNGALTDAGVIVPCAVDTEATVNADTGRALIAQGLAVAAEEAPKRSHEPKRDAADGAVIVTSDATKK